MTNAPELDANGNPIAPGGEEVTLTKVEYDQMTERLATLAQASTSTVEELKEMRRINAELKAKAEKADPTEVEKAITEVEKVIDAKLAAKEVEETKRTYEAAVANFLDEHPEFSTENDPGGVKFAAYQKALGRINLTALKSAEEFTEALNDALGLMERKANDAPNFSSSAPRSGASVPIASPHRGLSPIEEKLAKNYFGGDVAAYLKAKAKRPEYYEELLRYAR